MTVDTNILIGYLGGDALVVDAIKHWREKGIPLFLPAIAEAETLAFSNLTPDERKLIEKFLEENFIFVPFDRSVARIAARLRRETKLKFPDAAIAATALFTHTPLVTRNIKDFRRIPELQILAI